MKKSVRLAAYCLTFAIAMAARPQTAFAEPESTAAEESLSSDNSLSSIEIAQGELVPGFDPEQLTYTMTVSHETDRITLRAQTNAASAKKTISGTSDLEVGENTVVIKVTAQDGSVRVYQIVVTREAAEGTESQESTESQETPTSEEALEETEGQSDETSGPVGTVKETPGAPGTAGSENQQGGRNEADQFVVNPGQEEESFFETYRLPILMALAAILIVLCIIVSVLLLKRRGGDDETEEEEADEEEEYGEDEYDDFDTLEERIGHGRDYSDGGDNDGEDAEYEEFEEIADTDESAAIGKRKEEKAEKIEEAGETEDEEDDFEFVETAHEPVFRTAEQSRTESVLKAEEAEDDDFDFLDM